MFTEFGVAHFILSLVSRLCVALSSVLSASMNMPCDVRPVRLLNTLDVATAAEGLNSELYLISSTSIATYGYWLPSQTAQSIPMGIRACCRHIILFLSSLTCTLYRSEPYLALLLKQVTESFTRWLVK